MKCVMTLKYFNCKHMFEVYQKTKYLFIHNFRKNIETFEKKLREKEKNQDGKN